MPPSRSPRRAGNDVVLSDVRADDLREDAAQRKRRERLDGPFHPVVSDSIDYGESGAQFGAARSGRTHEGQDMMVPTGTPLVAVADGEVVEVGTDGGRGNYALDLRPRRGPDLQLLPHGRARLR